MGVRILALSTLREFWQGENSGAEEPMRTWFKLAERAEWGNFADVKATFGQTDMVQDRFIFDIGGNKWRVIAKINFEYQRMWIRWVGDHESYSKLTKRDIGAL